MRYLYLIALYLCFTGCNPKNTTVIVFKAHIAGYQIDFPAKAATLVKQGYSLNFKLGSQYIDTTETTKIAWLMNIYESGDEILKGLPDPRSAYGVNIYLKHKGYRLDSVKTALEQQFGKRFEPVVTSHLGYIWPANLAGYKLELNPVTTLFIRRATRAQGDPWSKDDTLRIAIAYNLSTKEQEYFAISEQQIAEDD